MISLKLDATQLETVILELNATDDEVKKALRSTVAKMARWLRTRAARSLSKELQIKQSVLRYRLKGLKVQRNADGTIGGLWIGLNDMDLKYIGAKQDQSGVVSKGQVFPKAFMGPRPGTKADKLNGRAFKRKGKARLPIEKVTLPIEEQANKALQSDVMEYALFEAQFFKTLEHELKWRTQ